MKTENKYNFELLVGVCNVSKLQEVGIDWELELELMRMSEEEKAEKVRQIITNFKMEE